MTSLYRPGFSQTAGAGGDDSIVILQGHRVDDPAGGAKLVAGRDLPGLELLAGEYVPLV